MQNSSGIGTCWIHYSHAEFEKFPPNFGIRWHLNCSPTKTSLNAYLLPAFPRIYFIFSHCEYFSSVSYIPISSISEIFQFLQKEWIYFSPFSNVRSLQYQKFESNSSLFPKNGACFEKAVSAINPGAYKQRSTVLHHLHVTTNINQPTSHQVYEQNRKTGDENLSRRSD